MPLLPILLLYCSVILVVSVAGGLVPSLITLTHRRMQLALSLVSGVMLGVGLLHMLGHAAEAALHAPAGTTPPSMHAVMLAALLGFLAMFLLERFFCFHHHETPDEHGHTCGHDHGHSADERPCGEDAPPSTHRLHWLGAVVGLTVHTLLAGIALGAAVTAGVAEIDRIDATGSNAAAGLAGFTVFLGIVLHKPFDSFTIVALMQHGGHRGRGVHLVNLAFALVIPIGVLLFLAGRNFAAEGGAYTTLALAFSAGTFLCVAASDVLPELQFHRHDRVAMTSMLVLGLAIAWASGVFEAHAHDHGDHAGHDHGDHAGHDHGDHAGHDHGDHAHDDVSGPVVGPPPPPSSSVDPGA